MIILTRHFNSYLKYKNEVRLKQIRVEVTITYISRDRGVFGHFCSLGNVHFVYEFRHDYKWSCF